MISHSFTHFLIQSEPFTRNSHGKCEFLTVLFVNEFCGKREPRRIRWSDTDCQESFCRKALLLGEEYNFRSTGSVSVNTTQESTMYSLLQFTLTFDLFLYLLMCISCSFTSGDKKKILFIFSWEREFNVWIVVKTTRQTTETVKEHIISCLDVTPADDLIAFNLYLWLWKREIRSINWCLVWI